jgi:hypothetical protein
MNDLSAELIRCREWIEAALEYSGGTHNFADIVHGIHSNKMQLWPSAKGCIVTEIVVYPRKKLINIFLGGGELNQILDMHSDVISWAKQQGCSGMTMTGRLGWKKPLAEYGWKVLHQSYAKEFE